MSTSVSIQGQTKKSLQSSVRAKYYTMPDGTIRLASIQKFNVPRFMPSGWEAREEEEFPEVGVDNDVVENATSKEENIARATRRAKTNAFDIILCNPDLDLFATFTYSPEKVGDKADYAECYKYLNTWLSNRVQRRGLKYVCVPERTMAGDIHFHAIVNSSALRLSRATNAHNGEPLQHCGKPLFNIPEWERGFTSAEFITRGSSDYDEREAVAKYIFKYMGKQSGQKIGGRYVLIGGKVSKPSFAYGDSFEDFATDSDVVKYSKHVEVLEGLVYDEWSFI